VELIASAARKAKSRLAEVARSLAGTTGKTPATRKRTAKNVGAERSAAIQGEPA
jgi:hypothetical protein